MRRRIFNLIILDESGSMVRIKKQAVDGVNETIQSIRKAQEENDNQEQFVSFVTFNDTSKTIYDCVPVDKIKGITDKDYTPSCCTALYDAMGFSLTSLRKNVSENDRVLVTIITDGLENSSKEYDNAAIMKLVEELKKQGWVFVYIGANQDAEKVAASMSIDNSLCFDATCEGTTQMLNEERECRRNFYACMADDDYPFKGVFDFFKRKKKK